MIVDTEIIGDSIEYYGIEKQSIVCMEECSELIQAISKELRGKHNRDHLAEEIADVIICVEMLKMMYAIPEITISNWIDFKQDRIKERMAGGENDNRKNDANFI